DDDDDDDGGGGGGGERLAEPELAGLVPMCRYGAACTDPDDLHYLAFLHPTTTTTTTTTRRSRPQPMREPTTPAPVVLPVMEEYVVMSAEQPCDVLLLVD